MMGSSHQLQKRTVEFSFLNAQIEDRGLSNGVERQSPLLRPVAKETMR
jgi:hypothetical protein